MKKKKPAPKGPITKPIKLNAHELRTLGYLEMHRTGTLADLIEHHSRDVGKLPK